MTFGNIQPILSKPIDQATALSPKEKELLSKYPENAETNYSCLIPHDIMDEFLAFANDVYRKHHNEATGMLVGYYLHNSKYPEKKIALATAFLSRARGSLTPPPPMRSVCRPIIAAHCSVEKL